MISTSVSFCCRSSSITRAPASPPPTITVRRVRRPSRVHLRTSRNRAVAKQQRDQADDVEGAEPDAREHVAGLGEERRADDDQKHDRPRRGEPHVLLLVAAERLHLIDVGGLEGEHRQHGDHEDGAEHSARCSASLGRQVDGVAASPTTMISANSTMRTKPASTIGEIGVGAGAGRDRERLRRERTATAARVRMRCSRSSTRLRRMRSIDGAGVDITHD